MKKVTALFIVSISLYSVSFSQMDSMITVDLPDTIKAVSYISDITISSDGAETKMKAKPGFSAGIRSGNISVIWDYNKGQVFSFRFPQNAAVITTGSFVKKRKGELNWLFYEKSQNTFTLMLSTATDSADNFTLYSAYVNTGLKRWKLIGTIKITGEWGTLKKPLGYVAFLNEKQPVVNFANVWYQRSNGSWKNFGDTNSVAPVINLYNHSDSSKQHNAEIKLIKKAIASGKTDTKENKDGIYYTILKEGTGRQVQLTDTVVAHYKGYLFSDGTVFDQTKDKPATFPLKRLIRGWQIGVPFCRVGGKIKLVIPSGLAYSIRTRAAKIPPNSILVFEIEVMDTKAETPK